MNSSLGFPYSCAQGNACMSHLSASFESDTKSAEKVCIYSFIVPAFYLFRFVLIVLKPQNFNANSSTRNLPGSDIKIHQRSESFHHEWNEYEKINAHCYTNARGKCQLCSKK